jgi:vacuolar-type H+-ATPase subunit I/STV1
MADDMTDNGSEIHDAAMRIGILSQRTTNLETVVGDVRRELGHSISAINQAIAAMSSKVDERFSALSTTMADRQRPQWQALSVILAFAAILGGLAYMPIREATNDLKVANIATGQTIQLLAAETNKTIQELAASTISRQEMNWRAERGAEDRGRTDEAIKDLRQLTVTRAEWGERNHARDGELAELNRRVDEIRQEVGAVYGTRDVIIDLKKEIDTLRQRLNSRPAFQTP